MSEIVPFWSPTGISDVSFPFYHLYCCSEFVFYVVLGLVITFVLFISILVFTIKSTPVNHRLSILCLFWLTLSFPANATGFNEAVKTANKQLKFYYRQNEWKFVQHQNISKKELIKGGLHLSFKGNQQFF